MMKKVIILTVSVFLWMNCVIPISRGVQSSVYSYLNPIIDGSYSDNGWINSLRLEVPFGFLHLKNTDDTFFFLIDTTKDSVEDRTTSKLRSEDGFELIFDWDGNRKISTNIDRVYSMSCTEKNRQAFLYPHALYYRTIWRLIGME
ncbi:hypothetical protein LLG10_03400 [bacterium]|nr:hypothetical protein [bacterium]